LYRLPELLPSLGQKVEKDVADETTDGEAGTVSIARMSVTSSS
jgi:hypothetical protein